MRTLFLTLICSAGLVFPASMAAMGDEHQHTDIRQTMKEERIAASGVVKSIGADHETIRIFHDPIPLLRWPSMNMAFEVADHELTHPLEVGDRVEFEFIQKEGKNLIVRIALKAPANVPASPDATEGKTVYTPITKPVDLQEEIRIQKEDQNMIRHGAQ